MKRGTLFTVITALLVISIAIFITNFKGSKAEQKDLTDLTNANVEEIFTNSFSETTEEAIERFLKDIEEMDQITSIADDLNAEESVIASKVAQSGEKIIAKLYLSKETSQTDATSIVNKVKDKIKEKYPDKEIEVEVETEGGSKVGTIIPKEEETNIPEIQVVNAMKLHAFADVYPFLLTVKLSGEGSETISAIRVKFESGKDTVMSFNNQTKEYSIDPNFYTSVVGPEKATITLLKGDSEVFSKELEIPMKKE